MAGVAGHAAGEDTPPSGVRPSDSPHHPSVAVPPLPSGSPASCRSLGCPRGWHVPQGESLPGRVDPALSAAICELEAWQAPDKATRDSLLLAKAEFLAEAGESARAYETVCRIQRFGLSEGQRAELLRRKLIYSWEAGLADDFMVLLEEAAAEEGGIDQAAAPDEAIAPAMAPATALSHAVATTSNLSGKPRHRSPDADMLLSIIPGAGLAYAGDWASAGKTFLAGATSIALGVGAFASGLYVSAFLGGGMLLYTILPSSTEKAVRTVSEYNDSQLLGYYSGIIEKLNDSPEND